ncbi:MAG: PD-(D/E)XK nuclease family protein [Treponema sp.]|nr:PD-(D/E)XK nuclease family protein [Candidatus Treponema merdequi]
MKIFSDEIVKSTIKNNIKNQNTIFVFATQIAASLWADKTLDFSGVTAVAMERFIAWDEFKGSSIKSHQAEKTSVPSTMRLVFAQNVIKQNAEKPFLKSIVKVEFAKTAARFASWISDILPSLAMWKAHFEKCGCVCDEEDKDYFEIYNRYKSFLDKNNLFDPAWETPPFNSDGKKYIIFFPEILMDYSEYQELLESSEDIQLVHIPSEYHSLEKPDGHLYSNTRIELKEVVNYLWKKHNEEKIEWNKIAISVPDTDTYSPYLKRDLELYQIPFIEKNGTTLSGTGAGKLFSSLLECYSENFSFNSVKKLLLNKELPWKNDQDISLLMEFGQKNNCFCSFKYDGEQIDVWLEAFKNPVDFEKCERQSNFYKELKRLVSSVVSSKTFSEIRANYFLFRETFFDFSKKGFSVQNDKILSRCIAELGSLIDLEEKYKDSGMFEMDSCYSFYCDYLDDKMYVPQNDKQGVVILPFKTAATAPYDVHVVVDASQNSTSVVYRKLSYLRNDKRARLGFTDEDNVTESFILLYAMVSQNDTLFTCSSKTIDAYAFTNSYLSEKDHNPKKKFADETYIKNDVYRNEKDSFVSADKSKFPEKIFLPQKKGFDIFKKAGTDSDGVFESAEKKFADKIKETLYQNNQEMVGFGKIKVSSSAMKKFYTCPRKFLLEDVLDARQPDNAAELINGYTKGTLNHKILEYFLKSVQNDSMYHKFLIDKETLVIPEQHMKYLRDAIDKALYKSEMSYLTRQVLLTEKETITEKMIEIVKDLYSYFDGYEIEEVEKWHNYVSEKDGYVINCKFDCILKKNVKVENDNGELLECSQYVLVDFKNSDKAIPVKNAFISEDVQIPDFQMPVYKFVYENQVSMPHINACIFYGLKEQAKTVVYSDCKEFTAKNIPNEELSVMFNKTQNVCIELIEKYASAVNNGSFDTSLADVTNDDCSGCVYFGVCRRIFTITNRKD